MEKGGAIINTASIQAYQPDSMLLAYASTKGAIVNFTKGLSQEAINRGIRVNAVAPGPIWTPLIPSTMPAEKVETFGQDTPMKRAGQPAELAPAYVFSSVGRFELHNGRSYRRNRRKTDFVSLFSESIPKPLHRSAIRKISKTQRRAKVYLSNDLKIVIYRC
jgi:NAD(P)-dependent dehydrogenase (short-subunit alcohol dehydrogenase family)